MSNQLLMTPSEVAVWLRRLRVAVIVYVAIVLLVGVTYIVARLVGAQFAALLVGAVATFAALAIGAVAWGGLWLAGLVFERGDQLERQRERIALLESGIQVLEAELEQQREPEPTPTTDETHTPPFPRITTPEPAPEPKIAPPKPAATAQPVARPSVEERFREAVEAGDVRAARDLWRALNGGVSAAYRADCKTRLDQLTARVADELRTQFAALIHREDFTAALKKGEEIAALLPDSRMRQDFEVIRPHLEARASAQ